MAFILKDFSDIVTAVMEELKIQSGDTSSKNRIKRDINQVYLNEVVPQKRWLWLSKNTVLEHKPYYSAGTASVTPDSTTVTLSVPPVVGAGSKARHFFAVNNFDEIYVIDSHTAGSATVTLSSSFTGVVNATASYKIWTDAVALPTDCSETVEVWHDYSSQNLEAVGLQEFRRISKESPRAEMRPAYYTTHNYVDPTPNDGETESDRFRVLKLWPAVNSNSTTIHIDYKKEVAPLDLDGDEPLMPIEDRIILVYGALHRAWSRERNPTEAQRNYQLFQNKILRMAGKVEDSVDKPQLVPDNRYMMEKRGRRLGTNRLNGPAIGGGASYTSPSFLTNATIGPGNNVTGNITADAGITIDGRDISVDGALLDTVAALPDGKILVGNALNVSAQVTPTGDITISNSGITAIVSDIIVNADINTAAGIIYSKLNLTNGIVNADVNSSAAIAYSKLALTGGIVNADVNASAAIAISKLATVTASRAIESSAGGIIQPSSVTSTELSYVGGVTSSIQTQLGTKTDKSTLTTKGDIYAATAASTPARVAVGTDGQVLTADAASSAGVKWATASTSTPIKTKTTTYSLLDGDSVILADTSGGAWTLTIQAASASNQDKIFRIRKTTSDFNTLTLSGGLSTTVDTVGETIEIINNGTTWSVLNRTGLHAKVSTTAVEITGFTSNPSKGTVQVDQAVWWREGNRLKCIYSYRQSASGSSGSGQYYFSPVPNGSGLTVDTTDMGAGSSNGDTTYPVVGAAYASNWSSWLGLTAVYTDDGGGKSGIGIAEDGSTTIGSGFFGLSNTIVFYSAEWSIPITGWKSY